MEALSIIGQLNEAKLLPRETLAIASERREEMVPLFIAEIENYLARDPAGREPSEALFYIFHLMGSWRETAAYRPLARLLRVSSDEIEMILGDATTQTSHRVMAAVFDGDPQPIYDIILDPNADMFVRSRMCEALPILVWHDKLGHHTAADFLRDCYLHLQPRDENYAWHGWQSAIAMLGLDELTPLVKEAYEREYISPLVQEFRHYQEDLQRALKTPGFRAWADDGSGELFGDTIEELGKWPGLTTERSYEPEDYGEEEEIDSSIVKAAWNRLMDDMAALEPVHNPNRDVGRNDPCPCGSGKKFKKCCLN